MRMMILSALGVLFLAGSLTQADAADRTALDPSGQQSKTVAAKSPETFWSTRCEDVKDKGKYCEVFQNLSVKGKDPANAKMKRVAEFAIGYSAEKKKKAQGVIILPLGVLVNEAVKVTIDDKHEFPAEIRYCDAKGCFAFTEISDGIIDKMRKGESIMIKSRAATGQEVNILMGLKGFAKAMDKVKA